MREATWTALKRGLRHLFRLRWEYRMIDGWQKCPCCEGEMGHQLNNPNEGILELRRRTRGHSYFVGNWVNCTICNANGVVPISPEYSYDGFKRGHCVTGRR
jgi:hypothetical protein